MTEEYTNIRNMKGRRVQVWAGDGTMPLGTGTYLGETTVTVWRFPDGALQSMDDASKPLTDEERATLVAHGYEPEEIVCNPVIQLDNGTIKYGCQVWWK